MASLCVCPKDTFSHYAAHFGLCHNKIGVGMRLDKNITENKASRQSVKAFALPS